MDNSKRITRNIILFANGMIAVGSVILKLINPIVVSYTDEIRRADYINFTVFTPMIMIIVSFILYRTLKPLRVPFQSVAKFTQKQKQDLRTAALNIPLRIITQFNIVILSIVAFVALIVDHFIFPFYPFYKRLISMGLIWSYTICTSFLVYAYAKKLVLPLLRISLNKTKEKAIKIPITSSVGLTALVLSATIILFLSVYGYFLTKEAYEYGAVKALSSSLISVKNKISSFSNQNDLKRHIESLQADKNIFLINQKGNFLVGKHREIPEPINVNKPPAEFVGDSIFVNELSNAILKITPLEKPFENLFLGAAYFYDATIRKKLRNMVVFLIMMGGFFLMFAWGILYYVAKGISETLIDIERRTRKLTMANEISYREIEVISHDEIGDLTIAFNELQKTVHNYHQQLTAQYSKYLSPNVAEQIKINPQIMQHTVRRNMTVLFSDLKEFTKYSETHSPEEVVGLLNYYFEEMATIIEKWDGTLDKYIGDGILAFWGAPLPQDNHAELALRCSIDMTCKLKELHENWKSIGIEPLSMGIGINTGEMVVGNMGAKGKKMEYTVIGDQVNIGERIEHLTRQYDTQILIAESTHQCLSDLFASDEKRQAALGHVNLHNLGPILVKGKKSKVTVYEVVLPNDGRDLHGD